jgi:hypothetical protein
MAAQSTSCPCSDLSHKLLHIGVPIATTLLPDCNCKYRDSLGGRKNVVELAEEDDWVVGTGGADLRKSAGHGKILYAMKVTDKKTLQEYFDGAEFACKKRRPNGNHKFGDNIEPQTDFDKHERFVLISEHFY